MPVIQRNDEGKLRLFRRNERLYTPRDFDYSPYFDIIKYPYLGFEDLAIYRKLPWDNQGRICNDENDCFLPETIEPQTTNIHNWSRKTTADTIADQKSGKAADTTKRDEGDRQEGQNSGVNYYPESNLAIDLLKQEMNKKDE